MSMMWIMVSVMWIVVSVMWIVVNVMMYFMVNNMLVNNMLLNMMWIVMSVMWIYSVLDGVRHRVTDSMSVMCRLVMTVMWVVVSVMTHFFRKFFALITSNNYTKNYSNRVVFHKEVNTLYTNFERIISL